MQAVWKRVFSLSMGRPVLRCRSSHLKPVDFRNWRADQDVQVLIASISGFMPRIAITRFML